MTDPDCSFESVSADGPAESRRENAAKPAMAGPLRQVLLHIVLFVLSTFLSYCFIHRFRNWQYWWVNFVVIGSLTVTIKVCVFGAYRLYHGWWRYIGLKDVVQIVKANHWSTFIFAVLYYVISFVCGHLLRWEFVGQLLVGQSEIPAPTALNPNRVITFQAWRDYLILLDWVGTVAMVAGSRTICRMFYEAKKRPSASSRPGRILIVADGDAADALLRDLQKASPHGAAPVGILTVDGTGRGLRIRDVPVLGTPDQLANLASEYGIDAVLLAEDDMPPEAGQAIAQTCERIGIPCRRFATLSSQLQPWLTDTFRSGGE